MTLSKDARHDLADRLLAVYGPGPARRLPLLVPLFGVKWCLILLNEFLPDGLSRRMLAGDARAHRTRLDGQLDKARAMLRAVAKDDAAPAAAPEEIR